MNLSYCCYLTFVLIGIAYALPSEKDKKVLDMSGAPLLSKTEGTPRSVNLSFFVPAFSLFALASQFMPQMFPALTTTTTSRRRRSRSSGAASSPAAAESAVNTNWIENFISNGLLY